MDVVNSHGGDVDLVCPAFSAFVVIESSTAGLPGAWTVVEGSAFFSWRAISGARFMATAHIKRGMNR